MVITKENINDVCKALNDLEYDETTDKEVCEWFRNLIYDFSEDGESFDEKYDSYEVQFEYFGSFHPERNILEIIEANIEDNKIIIQYETKFNGKSIDHKIRIPIDYAFNRPAFMTLWKKEVVKKHIQTLKHEIEQHHLQIELLSSELNAELKKINFVS